VREHHFVGPIGPLGPFADDYRGHLVAAGYSFGTIQRRNSQFAALSRWLASEGLTAGELNEVEGWRFVSSRRAAGRLTWVSPASVRLPLAFLRGAGVVAERGGGQGVFEELLGEYHRYLVNERGLADKTVKAHLDGAREFCVGVVNTPSELAGLRASDVTSYLLGVCGQQSASSADKTVWAVASLLRYLHIAAIIPTPLVPAVPKSAGRRRGAPPPGLTAVEVARLLASCDRRRGVGRRDHAILMLFARLGLRAGEVAALTLDDVDWRHGELIIRGKGNRHERLPLPTEVGAAVAAYLQRGRPKLPEGCRSVFLRIRAPWGPLALSGIQTVVREASRRAGLDVFGPRRLRQSAATRIHRGGASLAVIAEVLRHHDTRVTMVYLDIAEAALRELARPWPGGEA
jgi:site-specific recombinase XerD